MTDVTFSCRCGTVSGVLHDAAPREVCHLVCYCKDCRAFARHLGLADALEPGGGSPIVQIAPAKMDLTQGHDQIGCLRLSPKGLNRFYATCCNTPLANTPQNTTIPFAGTWRALYDETEAFGPVVVEGFVKAALPGQGAPRKDKGLFVMLGGLIRRTIAAYMGGTAKKTPFFGEDGTPIVVPRMLTPEERRAAYAE